jgi:hypothetical protein
LRMDLTPYLVMRQSAACRLIKVWFPIAREYIRRILISTNHMPIRSRGRSGADLVFSKDLAAQVVRVVAWKYLWLAGGF